MLVASLWLAVVVAVPGLVAWVVTALALGALTLGLVVLRPGPSRGRRGHLPRRSRRDRGTHLGATELLDADGTRRVAGVDADARAYLLLRPYLKRSVRVEITDPADPAPYWLVSTRHPDQLAAALTVLRDNATAG